MKPVTGQNVSQSSVVYEQMQRVKFRSETWLIQ